MALSVAFDLGTKVNQCPVHSVVAIADKKKGPTWLALLSTEYNEYYYVNAYTGESVWSLPPDVQPSDVGAPGWQGAQTTPVGECTCDEKLKTARRASMTAAAITNPASARTRRASAKATSEDQAATVLSKTASMTDMRNFNSTSNTKAAAAAAPVAANHNGHQDTATEAKKSTSSSSGDEAASILHNGAIFLKHGNHRKPHWKFVRLTDGRIEWLDLKQVQKNDDTNSKKVRVADIMRVHAGKYTDVFKHKRCDQVNGELCLSIVTKDRTLDLQAPTVEIRNIWVGALLAARTTTTFEVLVPSSSPPPPPQSPPPATPDDSTQPTPDHTQTQINHKKYLRAAAEQHRQRQQHGFRGRTVERAGPTLSQTQNLRRPAARSKSVHASRIPRPRIHAHEQ